MGAKRTEKEKDPHQMLLVDFEMLQKLFPISWSEKTLKRRIQSGFPAMRDGQDLLFDPQEVRDYFKRQRAK